MARARTRSACATGLVLCLGMAACGGAGDSDEELAEAGCSPCGEASGEPTAEIWLDHNLPSGSYELDVTIDGAPESCHVESFFGATEGEGCPGLDAARQAMTITSDCTSFGVHSSDTLGFPDQPATVELEIRDHTGSVIADGSVGFVYTADCCTSWATLAVTPGPAQERDPSELPTLGTSARCLGVGEPCTGMPMYCSDGTFCASVLPYDDQRPEGDSQCLPLCSRDAECDSGCCTHTLQADTLPSVCAPAGTAGVACSG